MERALLRDLVCPYCNGSFTVANGVETDADRLRYALVECRCFKFPIVDGVLLLSLTKAYGGAEEELQPYVPLQIAAIEFLGRGDARGLRLDSAAYADISGFSGRDPWYLFAFSFEDGPPTGRSNICVSDSPRAL